MRIGILLAALSALAASCWLMRESQRNRLVWDHFDVVKPGILYRSGQLNLDQLEAAVKIYGLKTIVSFQVASRSVAAERELAKRLKVDFLHLPMPGDGFGRADQFQAVVAACDDPDRRPVLIHCARGTCRTGAAVAYYRFASDGWTIEDVAAEMSHQTYRQGFLPGYVYSMVAQRPQQELFDPPIQLDRNRPEPPPSAAQEEEEAFDVH
jgi:protein tyrosine/serine phosphatase